ncbi:hypothetical protein [Rubripirellula lacrimiformis]|nr:hypothetical protein [Rubripirellula lacrimiformis]
MMFACVVILPAGCRTAPKAVPVVDSRVRRLAEDGREQYAEGDIERAIAKYQSALLRAWAMDDPTESGNAAYNLAACLTSDGRSDLARDWLADAHHELGRGGQSRGNAWLLQARIATEQRRFNDAAYCLDQSTCSAAPCDDGDAKCGCPTADGCRQCPLEGVPCIGAKIQAKRADEECQHEFQAQIHLARARLAAEQFDLSAAARHFACGCELAGDVCSHELHAELHDVAALIHVAKEEYIQAASHFDREARHLRLAGNYREIPGTLELAAAAYQQAGSPHQAAERWNRVARIWIGRGDAKKAWTFLRTASETVDLCMVDDTDSIRIRLSLVAREIESQLSRQPSPSGQNPVDDTEADIEIDVHDDHDQRLPVPLSGAGHVADDVDEPPIR